MHLADLITELNGLCGFMSILSSMRYCVGDPNDRTNIWFALGFMPFGLFFDFFDGKVARWRKKSSLMGQELDSLADLVRLALLSSLLSKAQTHLNRSPLGSPPQQQRSLLASEHPSITFCSLSSCFVVSHVSHGSTSQWQCCQKTRLASRNISRARPFRSLVCRCRV